MVRSDLVCGVGLKERSMAPWWIPALVPKSLVIHVNPDGKATFFLVIPENAGRTDLKYCLVL